MAPGKCQRRRRTCTRGNGCGCNAAYTYLWSNGATSATATGLAAGMHYVTMTDAGGLTYLDSVHGFLHHLRNSGDCQYEPQLCIESNGGINISVAGANAIAWRIHLPLEHNSALTEDLTNVGAGSYSVTGYRCIQVAQATQSFTPDLAHCCSRSRHSPNPGNLLTASQAWPTYQWLMNGSNILGATNMTYVIANRNLFLEDHSLRLGCKAATTTTCMIVGIDAQMGQWSDMAIFPNPTTGQFTLETGNPIGFPIQVLIRDMFGRTLRMENLQDLGQQQTFDIRNFAAGNYMVEVTSDLGHRKVFRLVVQ